MDAFELMMHQAHLDQGIGIKGRVVVDEALQIPHQFHNGSGILRGRVHDTASSVLQGCALQFAKAGVVLLELGLDRQHVIGG